MSAYPFRLAFPVTALQKARAFYGGILGCREGRSSDAWVDFDLYGHQIVAHRAPDEAGHRRTSAVDGDDVRVRHFGVVLPMGEWNELAARLRDPAVEYHHRAARPLQGRGRRAGHDVLPRPLRQCPRIQGVRGSVTALREVSA